MSRTLVRAEAPALLIRLRDMCKGVLSFDEQIASPDMHGDFHPFQLSRWDKRGSVEGVVQKIHQKGRQILVGKGQ